MQTSRSRIALLFAGAMALLASIGTACGEDSANTISAAIAVEATTGGRLDSLDFGSVPIGASEDRTFLVRAAQAVSLRVQSIEIEAEDGAVASAWEVVGDRSFTVPALEALPVTLRFRPQQEGNYAAVAVIRSNDPERPAVRLPLTGVGIVGRLEISACLPSTQEEPSRCAETRVSPPDALWLGEVLAGGRAEARVILFNGGGDAVQVERVELAEGSAAEAAGFVLPETASRGMTVGSREEVPFTVRFEPPADASGPASATVRVVTPDENLEIVLQAEVAANRPPLACLHVRAIRSVDGITTEFEPGDPALEELVVEPTEQVILDAAVREGCTGDPEDGDDVTLHWTITGPRQTVRLQSVPGEPMQRRLEAEFTGEHVIELSVADRMGLVGNADERGNPARIRLTVAPRRDIGVELGWGDDPDVDLDLHFVRGAGTLGSADDAHHANPSPDWGNPGIDDDPHFFFDDQGGMRQAETVALNHPESTDYWIYVRFHEDRRPGRNAAPVCTVDSDCSGGLACAGGRCMETVEARLKIFLEGQEVDLSAFPGFVHPQSLRGPCDTWLAGKVVWPGGGATPEFVPVGHLERGTATTFVCTAL